MNDKIPLIWTNDDVSIGNAEDLSRMVDFLGQFGIHGSFAVVPIKITGDRPKYIIIEIPGLDDVTFHAKPDEIDKFADLGWQQWEACLENNWPYVMISHWHSLKRNNDSGYKIHQILLGKILSTGLAEPMTLSQYYEKLKNGTLPFAESEEIPDTNEIPSWHVWNYKEK